MPLFLVRAGAWGTFENYLNRLGVVEFGLAGGAQLGATSWGLPAGHALPNLPCQSVAAYVLK